MKAVTLALLLTQLIIFGSCIDKHAGEPLTIKNNSEQRIYYWYSYWETENYLNYHFPDTILPIEKPVHLNSIAPHNATGDGESDPDWIKKISELPEGKFSIYFFNKQPETQEEWDLVRQTYDLFRKDITYQELKDNNYTISYP